MEEKSPKPVMGRPKIQLSDLPEGWKEKMLEHAREGATDIELRVDVLDCISHKTWERLINEEDDFLETVETCRELSEAYMTKLGKNGITSEGQFRANVYQFMMQNKYRWTERREITGDSKKPVVVENINTEVSKDQLEAMRKARVDILDDV